MKNYFASLLIAISLFSCKKETIKQAATHVKADYRVGIIGKAGDTTFSTTQRARIETVGLLIVEDNELRVELMSYQNIGGIGVYTVKATNKKNCQGILRWNYEGLRLFSITPNDSTANTPQADVLKANQIKTYTITGEPKTGKIKVKMDGQCGNSSTLILNITLDILPVVYIEHTTTYDEKTDKVMIAFTIDDPLEAEWILIQRNDGTPEWKQVMLIASDKITKSYSIKL